VYIYIYIHTHVEMVGAQSGQAKTVFPLLKETCCNTKGGDAWSKK
jgi:hypothetical protein